MKTTATQNQMKLIELTTINCQSNSLTQYVLLYDGENDEGEIEELDMNSSNQSCYILYEDTVYHPQQYSNLKKEYEKGIQIKNIEENYITENLDGYISLENVKNKYRKLPHAKNKLLTQSDKPTQERWDL